LDASKVVISAVFIQVRVCFLALLCELFDPQAAKVAALAKITAELAKSFLLLILFTFFFS
jgi:hypothetical protein